MEEELLKRYNLLMDCEDNIKAQAGYMKLCELDILYWFNNFTYTDKNTSLY